MLYLDSSAVVKRYVAEAGSSLVAAAVREHPYVATALVTMVEVRAALAAAARAGRIPNLQVLVANFRRDWPRYLVIGVDSPLAERAADLAERHALRGYDAVQLAAALVAAQASPGVRFGTFDLVLQRAARAEGLQLL